MDAMFEVRTPAGTSRSGHGIHFLHRATHRDNYKVAELHRIANRIMRGNWSNESRGKIGASGEVAHPSHNAYFRKQA